MAYKPTRWKDHVVERPRTYTEVANSDGSVTHTPAPGEVIQEGTPQSATNFNKPEVMLQHLSIAYDWWHCITQAENRAQADRIEDLEAATSALTT